MGRGGKAVAAGLLVMLALANRTAAEPCGLCATEVRINSSLAKCLLGQYASLAARGSGVIVVDLTQCESERGVVEALPTPSGRPADQEPDLQFIVSRLQLDCLKGKLEEPGLVRDPLTRIDLGTCQ